MNLSDKNMFDELVRQKLEGYAEPPDLHLLNNIHSKKNRLLKLYGLYRLLIITSAIGLGLLGSYFLHQYTHASDQVVETSALTTTAHDQNQGSTIHSSDLSSERELSSPTGGERNSFNTSTSATTAANSTNSFVAYTTNNSHGTNPGQVAGKNSQVNQAKNGIKTSNRSTTQKQSNSNTLKQNKSNKNTFTHTDNTINSHRNNSLENENTNTTNPVKPASTNHLSDSTQSSKTENNPEKTSSACDVKFDYYMSYTDEANFTNFSDVPRSANFRWNFGDGSQSAQSSPSHKYTQQGHFIVTLTVTDENSGCSNTYQKDIQVGKPKQQNTIINLKGIVREGRNLSNMATVELVKYNESLGRYESFSALTNAEGTFTFVDIKAGKYWLLAHAQRSGYVNTYWGGSKNIYDAPEIIINTNEDIDITGYNIDLIYEGNDQAIGDKGTPNNFPDDNNDPLNDPSSGHVVVLVDEHNNIIAETTSDPNGNVNFDNVPSGNYKLVDTKTGNSANVSVDNGSFNSNVSGISAMSGKTPGSGSGVSNPSAGGGAGNMDAKVVLSPNPAVQSVNVDLQSYQQESLSTVVLINANGTELMRKQVAGDNLSNISIDISAYPPGIYYVMVFTKSGHIVTSQLMKNASSSTGGGGAKGN